MINLIKETTISGQIFSGVFSKFFDAFRVDNLKWHVLERSKNFDAQRIHLPLLQDEKGGVELALIALIIDFLPD